MPTPMSPEYKISERETESASNIDALYNNICCVPFMKYSGKHTEKGRYMVVCHDLGASYFTVYMLSRGTEHEHRASGVEEEEGGRKALKILL